MNTRADPTVGRQAARAQTTTRRGTPWQDRSPSVLWQAVTAVTAASSPGPPPAHTRHATSTREHQTGRAPTRSAPTRRAHPPRSPPGASLGRPAHRPQGQAPPGWPPASLDPGEPADHAQTRGGKREQNVHITTNAPPLLDEPFHIRTPVRFRGRGVRRTGADPVCWSNRRL